MVRSASSRVIEVALVNNMPDQALAATDLQFARLIQAGAGGREVRWRRYYLPGFDRSETAQKYLARGYEDVTALYRRGADALIVTGTEPRAASFEDEPYWPAMTRLVDWARTNTTSTLWSCLGAHAAAYRLDGIRRRRRAAKLSGIFACERVADDWAGSTETRQTLVPHSRYNELAREDLEAHGYSIGSVGEHVGVDIFWRREPSLFLFLQGHPEYDADTLLKEYRRDVLRFATGQRDEYPEQPVGAFSLPTRDRLDALRERARAGVADVERELVAILTDEKSAALWASDSIRLYRDWLGLVSRQTGALRETA